MDDIYSLTSGNYIEQLSTVDNMFIRQLFVLAKKYGVEKKMLGVVGKNKVSNTASNSILDICNLPPLLDKSCSNVVEDIAQYRWNQLSFNYDKSYWKERSHLLFLDYLLSSCLCYVEVFDNGGSRSGGRSNQVDKFYATRNRFIAARVAKLEDGETGKYVNYLTSVLSDYKIESLRVLKLSRQKKGFKITQPKSAINFSKTVKITPLFFITSFINSIIPVMKDNIIKFTYYKDNGQERELITTLSEDVFTKYYDKTYAENIVKSCEVKMDRGYLRVPELGCSKYDDTGVRALNLSRIINIEIIDDFDTSYIDVDFNSILPMFRGTVELIRNIDVLKLVYQSLMNKTSEDKSIVDLRSDILSYVDGRFALGTTTFQKELHNYMKQYTMIFKNYTGKPTKFTNEPVDSFNMGIE